MRDVCFVAMGFESVSDEVAKDYKRKPLIGVEFSELWRSDLFNSHLIVLVRVVSIDFSFSAFIDLLVEAGWVEEVVFDYVEEEEEAV